jgi:hypothetical protein
VLVDEQRSLHEQVIVGLVVLGRVDDVLVEELVTDVHHNLQVKSRTYYVQKNFFYFVRGEYSAIVLPS